MLRIHQLKDYWRRSVSSKADPYCCVSNDDHIIHHCIHRSLDDMVEKARATKFKLTDAQAKEIQDIVDNINDRTDDGNLR
jgi:hypothetical protein